MKTDLELDLLRRHIRSVIADPRADAAYIAYLLRKLIKMRRSIRK